MQRNWIELEGVANLRDVGGITTTDGAEIAPGRLLRSDNLQDLTPSDIEELLARGVSDVVDLRSDYEVASEGPGPLARSSAVRVHHHSLFREQVGGEAAPGVGEEKPDDEERPEVVPEEALPWVDLTPSVEADHPVASIYLSYLHDRPDSVLAALREIAGADGATLVHCAAGKDRTGTVVALALLLAGADRDEVVADYAASSERVEGVLDRLLSTPTYADNLRDRPLSSHLSHPETMRAFLDHVDAEHGSVEALLAPLGWTPEDTARIRAKLRD